MEAGRFKLRISRMFRDSFGSCRSRNITKFIEKPVFVAQERHDFHLTETLSPKVRTFPSMYRSRCQERMEVAANDNVVTKKVLQRAKVSGLRLCFVSGDPDGRTCPPASPISPLNSYYKFQEFETEERKKKTRKTKKTHKRNKKKESYQFSSSSIETNCGWFSSEDERVDETETFFSSKSFSSDSSEYHRRNKRGSRRKVDRAERRRAVSRNSDMVLGSFVTKGKVKESFAVVKRSSDPYNDFRESMVEMIVEKQIFAAKDLEQLLQCFLSLNSSNHHKVIVEVFVEIWDALFSNWS